MAEMVLAEAPAATAAAFDALNEARKRDRLVNTIYQSGTIAILGTIFYGVCWVYQVTTDINIDLRNAIGDIPYVNIAFPAVDPWLATDQASADYAALLGIDPNSIPDKLGALANQFIQDASYLIAPLAIFKELGGNMTAGSPEYLKWSNFDKARASIAADGGFNGSTTSYYAVCDAWGTLYKAGDSKIDPNGAIHPVDALTNFVVQNKWYWGGVIGLTSIPMISLGISTLKEVEQSFE